MLEPAILAKLAALPDEKQREVLDYIEFLSQRYSSRHAEAKPGFTFAWAGGLAELRDSYTSTQLQHEALKWR